MPTNHLEAPLDLLRAERYEQPALTSDEQGERAWLPDYSGPAARAE